MLVVVPSAGTGTRLMDVLPLLDADHRISTVFTVVPDPNGSARRGAEEFLRTHACLVLPWQEALRSTFDLVLAAGPRGLTELGGKTLLLPDGAGTACLSDGPLPATTVVGDLCYDRLLSSIPFRARYREALGLSGRQRLVITTWQPETAAKLVNELPGDHFRVAVVVHPDEWGTYGGWQIRAWLADILDAGALLISPDKGWRAALIAADLVVGPSGPVTNYGAAIGLPVMVTTSSATRTHPGGVADLVRRLASPLREDRPAAGQVRAVMARDRSWQDRVAARITSRPGRAGEILRRIVYRALDLTEPARPVPCSPLPMPRSIADMTPW